MTVRFKVKSSSRLQRQFGCCSAACYRNQRPISELSEPGNRTRFAGGGGAELPPPVKQLIQLIRVQIECLLRDDNELLLRLHRQCSLFNKSHFVDCIHDLKRLCNELWMSLVACGGDDAGEMLCGHFWMIIWDSAGLISQPAVVHACFPPSNNQIVYTEQTHCSVF